MDTSRHDVHYTAKVFIMYTPRPQDEHATAKFTSCTRCGQSLHRHVHATVKVYIMYTPRPKVYIMYTYG